MHHIDAGDDVLASALRDDPGFTGDPELLAAFFLAGDTTVLVETARQVIAGRGARVRSGRHRIRLDRLFNALQHGVAPHP